MDGYLYKKHASIAVTLDSFFFLNKLNFKENKNKAYQKLLKCEVLSLLLIFTACSKPLLHFYLT